MAARKLDRRHFIKTSALLSSLAAAGRLPLLGAEPGNGSGIDAATGPAAVKPIRGHLAQFAPVAEGPANRQNYTLTYDIVHWDGVGRRARKTANSVLGSLAVSRRKRDGQVRYEVTQRTRFGGVDNIVEAQIVCAADQLNSLRSWRMHSYGRQPSGEAVPLSELTETGRNRQGRIQISDAGYRYAFTATRPVVSQWTVLDFLVRHATEGTVASFDLLQDLSLFKADQKLVCDGVVSVPVKGGRTVELTAYAQTGEGVLPIHYLLDEQRRPQLVTGSLVSWALSGLS